MFPLYFYVPLIKAPLQDISKLFAHRLGSGGYDERIFVWRGPKMFMPSTYRCPVRVIVADFVIQAPNTPAVPIQGRTWFWVGKWRRGLMSLRHNNQALYGLRGIGLVENLGNDYLPACFPGTIQELPPGDEPNELSRCDQIVNVTLRKVRLWQSLISIAIRRPPT